MSIEYTRRDFLRLSGLTAANFILPRLPGHPPSDELPSVPEQYEIKNFTQLFSKNFPEKDICQTNSSGPLALASTLIDCHAISTDPKNIKGVVWRSLMTDTWKAIGTDLENLAVLGQTYGLDYQINHITSPQDLHRLLSDQPYPLLAQVKLDGYYSRGYTVLVVGSDPDTNSVTIFNPNNRSGDHLSTQNYSCIVPDQNQETPILVPSSETISTLDSDGLPIYLAPQVLAWREEIVAYTPDVLKPAIVATLMQIESEGKQNLTSPSGAKGLLQVMGFHFKPGENRYDPRINIQTGCRVFYQAMQRASQIYTTEKDILTEAARRYHGSSNQYAKDFWNLLSGNHQGIDDFYRRRTGN